jgi:hypothetical protein
VGRTVVRFEIGCKDSAKTQEFYKKLFDWLSGSGRQRKIAHRTTEKTRGAVMKSMRRARIMTMSIAVVLSLPLRAALQEKTAEKPAIAAARPGAAEMDRLKFYLGEWEYTETYPKSAFSPNGGKNTGVYTSKLGPGGNSLINTFRSQGPVGDFEGLLVMTWDAREKAYKAYAFGNDFPGALVETGTFEGDALVFRSEFPAEGATLKLRNVTRLTAPGKIESEEYMAMKDAPESLLVRVEAKKR